MATVLGTDCMGHLEARDLGRAIEQLGRYRVEGYDYVVSGRNAVEITDLVTGRRHHIYSLGHWHELRTELEGAAPPTLATIAVPPAWLAETAALPTPAQVRTARVELGLSQRQLTAQLNQLSLASAGWRHLSRGTIADIERGSDLPSIASRRAVWAGLQALHAMARGQGRLRVRLHG